MIVWLRLKPPGPPVNSAIRPSPLSPTTRSVNPLPVKSPANPETGADPRHRSSESRRLGPISEIEFEPEFKRRDRVPEPVKLPRNKPLGAWPTG